MTPTAQTSRSFLHRIWSFLLSRIFWKNLLYILIFFGAVLGITIVWLNLYTRHGQKLELPDYTGFQYADALKDAGDKSFRMAVTDSIHVVGKNGGEILQQNPEPFSKVKENRTIYVTVTKHSADQISIERLPVLYGKNYERKKRELFQSFEIKCRIAGRQYDPGQPDHILAVIYEGETIIDSRARKKDVMIAKGGTLEFILSERSGGSVPIPDLICKNYQEAKFVLDNLGIDFGEIIWEGTAGATDQAFITSQSPESSEGSIRAGNSISVSLSQDKPKFCND